MITSTETLIKTFYYHVKFKNPDDTRHFHSSNHHKWLPYQILGGKTVNNVQIDQQTMDIWLS